MAEKRKAEQLKINPHEWDASASQFIIQMSCKFGDYTRDDYTVRVTLTFDANGPVTLKGSRTIVKQEGGSPDPEGFWPIEPLGMYWDRNGGTFTGTVQAHAVGEIVDPKGNVVDQADGSNDIKVTAPA